MSNSSEFWTIDKARSYFMDPHTEGDTTRLALLAAQLTAALGHVYGANGNLNEFSGVLQGLGDNKMGIVLRELVSREAGTRRFDHKFMGQIHPQGNEIAILAKLAAGIMNTNTVVKEVSQAEHGMEYEVLDWMARLMGYDLEEYSGNLTSGGSTANLEALWVARERLIENLRAQGRYTRGGEMVVIASEMAHYSIEKAASMLGDNVVLEQAKSRGYLTDIEDVDRILESCQKMSRSVIALVGLGGETETGMIDDLAALADLAQHYGVFYHVDAAYCGPFKLILPDLFEGIDRADSITIDPHKLLYTSYPCGAVLFRNKKDQHLIRNKARYLQEDGNKGVMGPKEKRNFGNSGRVEGSMGSDGALMAWASLQLFGEAGYRVLLQHSVDLARIAYEHVSQSKILRTLHRPHTSTQLIGLRSMFYNREESEELFHRIQSDLEKIYGYYVSVNERVEGGVWPAFRTVYVHPWTEKEDVLDMLGKLEEVAKAVTN